MKSSMFYWAFTCAWLAFSPTGGLAGKLPSTQVNPLLVDGRIHQSGEVEWMMVADDQGEPQLAILSGIKPTAGPIVLRDNVTFILYTRENDAANGTQIYVDELDSLVGFNPANPTKIMIHGFTGDLTSNVIQASRKGYLQRGEYNAIGVDWGVLCLSPFYNIAKDNALLVGPYVADLINFLVRDAGAKLSDIHLIGHSLGGQVIGLAGRDVDGGKVARITGLDPALPLFDDEHETDENRLDPTDGVLVDVIHTDGGALGWLEPRGHIDFYPNGGIAPQPGCGTDITGQCSHTRCHVWFADSINNRTGYPAHLCSSFQDALDGNCSSDPTGYMGDEIEGTPSGIYFLETTPM